MSDRMPGIENVNFGCLIETETLGNNNDFGGWLMQYSV